MANWDIFHSDRLETERDLTSGAVRTGLLNGSLVHDDLIRPAGSERPWTRIGDVPALKDFKPAAASPPKPTPTVPKPAPKPISTPVASPPPPPIPKPEPPAAKPKPPSEVDLPYIDDGQPAAFLIDDEDDKPKAVDEVELLDAIIVEEDDDEDDDVPFAETPALDAVIIDEDDDEDDSPVLHVASPQFNLTAPSSHSRETFGEFNAARDDRVEGWNIDDDPSSAELVAWDDDDEEDPQDEDEAAAEFTLSRKSAETVEELDLAAMVDVAFQLVLFFLVTATTILYKSLEVPKPNAEKSPDAAAQARPKTLDDLKDVFILVEIDPTGAIKIDREPIQADLKTLIQSLRNARDSTDRKAMLLSADFTTPHKSAVLAYDAANEIGLSIAIARPSPPNPNAPPPPVAKGG